jgi:hypothetical protein
MFTIPSLCKLFSIIKKMLKKCGQSKSGINNTCCQLKKKLNFVAHTHT